MFGNLGKMMKMAGQMREKLPELQQKLAETMYVGEAGGGAVRATVNGKLALEQLEIEPSVLAEGDPGKVEELIIAAVSSAQQRAADAAQEAMQELTGGMDLPALRQMLGM